MKLSQAIAQVPKSVLVTGRGENRGPNFAGIFEDAVSRLLEARGVKFDKPTLKAISEHVNVSTFQRQAAAAVSKHLYPERHPVKEAKPAKPVVKKSKRGTDPITGETKTEAKKREAAEKKAAKAQAKLDKELAKADKPTKAAKAKAAKSPVKADKPAKASANPEFAKAKAKAAAEKKIAAAKVEVDPITGEATV